MKRIWLCVFLYFIQFVKARHGGNDIFTSLEAMRRLWLEERVFVQNLQDSIETMKAMIPVFERYVKNHQKLELDQEPNVEYLGHPINAYNLIKHSALGKWRDWSTFVEFR